MSRTIGLIQTRGIGDIIIALPIATRFVERGDRVIWPVDSRYRGFFQKAAPWIEFLDVPHGRFAQDAAEYFHGEPHRILTLRGCDQIFSLYSRLAIPGLDAVDAGLADSLKFDEYKYALTGVPFLEKWNLRIERDPAREIALFESLELDAEYICIHRRGHDHRFEIALPEAWHERYRIVEVDERTESPFDWLYTLEGAAKLVLVDSCFANLVEQLGLPAEKYFLLRSTVPFTPVLRNAWTFLTVQSGAPAGAVDEPRAWIAR
ncbi:MAG: hypothetical protein ABI794_07770 [Betaproteobacteria bacterium]